MAVLSYPHAKLLHAIGLFQHAVRKAETLKNLERAALQTVRLPVEDLGSTLVNNARVDSHVGHPGGAHEAVTVMGGELQVLMMSKGLWRSCLPRWSGAYD